MMKQSYTRLYAKSDIRKIYPNEMLVRIFKGNYPNLNLDKSYTGKKICDIGCGDGRNLILLNEIGLECFGTEISPEIAYKVESGLKSIGIRSKIICANNEFIPVEGEFFDYLLSWNSCYYMGEVEDFSEYVEEFARILKPAGKLVFSIPMKTHSIFQDCSFLDGYTMITNDPNGIRNGEVFRIFEDQEEIEAAFSKHFKNFSFGAMVDDCFGLNNHWFVGVCEKI